MFEGFKKWLASKVAAKELEELANWKRVHDRHRLVLRDLTDATAILDNMHAEVYGTRSRVIVSIKEDILVRRDTERKYNYDHGRHDGYNAGIAEGLKLANAAVQGALV